VNHSIYSTDFHQRYGYPKFETSRDSSRRDRNETLTLCTQDNAEPTSSRVRAVSASGGQIGAMRYEIATIGPTKWTASPVIRVSPLCAPPVDAHRRTPDVLIINVWTSTTDTNVDATAAGSSALVTNAYLWIAVATE